MASSSAVAAPPKKVSGVRWKSVVALQAPHTKSAPAFRAMQPRNNGPHKPHRLPGPAFVGIKGAHTLPVNSHTLPVHKTRDPP